MDPSRSRQAEEGGSAIPCVTCGIPLPIEVDPTSEHAISLACSFCGCVYRATLSPATSTAPRENITIVGD